MEPVAHSVVAELEEAEHAVPVRARRGLKLDTTWWSTFALLLVAICLTVTGELLLKTGMNRYGELNVGLSTLVPTAVKLFTSPWVVGGFAFALGCALFWLAVLSRWNLSVADPMLSISYIIGIAASVFILKEKVGPVQFLGVVVIIPGVFLVSRSSD
jgi:drug/metabolite transporter (DMT)-like permease